MRATVAGLLAGLAGCLLLAAPDGYCQQNGQPLPQAKNPVLPGVADAGVLHYNGEYYIGGVFTNGSFYRSSDLVHWEGPFHVFSMDNAWTEGASAGDNQIHASDIHYLNGRFHHYWSVNYWGRDRHVVHIGHAVSPDVLGPYQEPDRETWLANRIDPHLFRDVDGKLYLYMVKFTDGNTIWVRPMEDPATFSGAPRYLFASLPGTWETLDNRVAEGPWVVRYRDRYYMMYNANHTSTAWGNYSLGVAEAAGPLEFNHGSKYPHPVLTSNQADLEDLYPDLLKFASEEDFRYTFREPDEDWTSAGYDDTGWREGKPGFGSAVIENSTTRRVRTGWDSGRIWVRKSFRVDRNIVGNLSLRMHHDGATRVFLNGILIYSNDSRQYIHRNFDEKALSALKDGENLLAVESSAGARSAFLDLSLFDMNDQRAGDILYSPGQPNLVRGPNGFEWWLVYMANKNAERRGQYISRVHFLNGKLTVDGVSGVDTLGDRPAPALPVFGDLFSETDDSETGDKENKWLALNGEWRRQNGELVHAGREPATILPRTRPASHYLFETGVKPAAGDAARPAAGIYAWRKDEDHWLRILLDPRERKWVSELLQGDDLQVSSFSLPEDFDYASYHKISVSKNGGEFRVRIDDMPAPGQPVIEVPALAGPGLPGLFTRGAGAAFDGILYTIGWDEFDEHITGWEPVPGDQAAARWNISPDGIGPSAVGPTGTGDVQDQIREKAGPQATDRYTVLKGDPAEAYEFSLQVTRERSAQAVARETDPDIQAGIYPVYIDDDNYLEAIFDGRLRKLVIAGKRNGVPVGAHDISLEKLHPVYADMKYTDLIEKRFTFETPVRINGLRFSKTAHQRPDTLIDDIYRKMDIFYQAGDRWHLLEDYHEEPSTHPGFVRLSFPPLKATAIKLVNRDPTDRHFYTYKLWVSELFRDSYHLRVSKLAGVIIFNVNGQEVFRMPNDFSSSRVGLTANSAGVRFNGITYFSRGGRP